MSDLPKFTNKQQRVMIQRLCNRLALAPVRTCRTLHSCVLCGKDITDGQEYRDKGYGARAHEGCFKQAANPAATIQRLIAE
jgi:hypothetical protein